METKSQLRYDEHTLLYRDDNRSYRYERLYSGLLGVFVGVALGAFGWAYFTALPFRITVLTAACVLGTAGVAQMFLCIRLARYPFGIVVDMDRIVFREGKRYHYIDFADLGEVRFDCKSLRGAYCGDGRQRLEFDDDGVTYYIGELKKRVVTRDAPRLAFIVDHRRLNAVYRDWNKVYENARKKYKKMRDTKA